MRINIPLHHIRDHTFRLHADVIPVLSLTVDSADSSNPLQSIELATFKFSEENCISKLGSLVKEAKKRAHVGGAGFIDQPVVVDYGIAADEKRPDGTSQDIEDTRTKEQIVCEMLAIPYGPEVWCTFQYSSRRDHAHRSSFQLQDPHYQ